MIDLRLIRWVFFGQKDKQEQIKVVKGKDGIKNIRTFRQTFQIREELLEKSKKLSETERMYMPITARTDTHLNQPITNNSNAYILLLQTLWGKDYTPSMSCVGK